VSRRDGVLRVPAAAVRFKPTAEQLEALSPRAGDRKVTAGAVAGKPAGDRLWLYRNGGLTVAPVRVGAADGQYVELLDGAVQEGTRVVTRVTTADEQVSRPSSASNPLLQQPRGRR
jgi:multidrug efflux pump subunit AcrA (membrane-fusion protein)